MEMQNNNINRYIISVIAGIIISFIIFLVTLFLTFINIDLMFIYVIIEEILKSFSRLFRVRNYIYACIFTYASFELFIKIFSIYFVMDGNIKYIDWALLNDDLRNYPIIFLGGYAMAVVMHLATAVVYVQIKSLWLALSLAFFIHYGYNLFVDIL